jgi:TonB family protein
MKAISYLLLASILVGCSFFKKPAPKPHPISGPLNERQESYRQCYIESDSYQGRQDKTIGNVSVKFTVTNSGEVKDASIAQSDFKDANFHACLLDQVRKISFPDVFKETIVEQPIRFTPVEQ